MKFNLFGKKSKCLKCGKKFKNETELAEHEHTAHTYSAQILFRAMTSVAIVIKIDSVVFCKPVMYHEVQKLRPVMYHEECNMATKEEEIQRDTRTIGITRRKSIERIK